MEELLIYFRIIRKRWLPASLVFVVVFLFLGYERSKKTIPLYRATGTIVFDQKNPSITDPFAVGEQKKLNNDLILIKSESLAEKVKEDLKLPLEIDHKKLAQNLIAVNPDKSDVIQLSFTDEDPKKATEIVNAWIRNYVQIDKEQKVSQTRALAKFLEQQIPESQESLEYTAEKLKNFKQNNRILDINAEATSTISIISELDSQIANINSELASQKSRLNSLKKIFPVDSEAGIASSFMNESPIVGSLVKQIQEIQLKIEQEKIRFGDQHPQVITLQKQEAVLQEQLKNYSSTTNIQGNSANNSQGIYQPGSNQSTLLSEYAATERQIKSLEAQLKSLKELINVYRQRVDTLPQLEFEQQQLQRELTARSDVLQNLIKNYQDAQIAINNTQGNIRSTELASIPTEPAINRRLTYLIQGFLGGILAGSVVAYLLDQLDQRINNVDQIKEYFTQPVLGKIPDFYRHNKDKVQSDLPVRDNPSSPISENFRALYTGLKFMETEEKPLKIITISSSVAGEGKSTIAANMAIAASGLGTKVLLIEADLRKPGQQKIWEGIDKSAGLSDLLQIEHNSSLSEVIIPLMTNLDLLPAGNTKSNPVALIGSSQMVHLLDELSDKYDLIILDAPPVSVAADAQILGRMSDGMLMVIRQEKANTSMLASSSESLSQADVNILGLLLNCFISDSDNYYYYYNYSYYYDKKDKKKNQLFN
ncbi:tyrosine-protein kinase EpsD [Geminocystis sp. NIES-3708]|uniref:GumC family protein n=1 Tax=Geminocystis sp. NIES-3708 TaxID=1615909 RepID=UPI0005FC5CD8|nr:polysaccharide biosynthesis tyrosine autokinase [Geminocystis sp. NIES-3708]BAQ62267.1 tyrosine-protein kinase EpsD [Geminocystis sp. NIES-3708]